MELIWDVLIAFHMALKLLIQKKLSFREIGKNTEKPNGKIESKCRKTEFLRFQGGDVGSIPTPCDSIMVILHQ